MPAIAAQQRTQAVHTPISRLLNVSTSTCRLGDLKVGQLKSVQVVLELLQKFLQNNMQFKNRLEVKF